MSPSHPRGVLLRRFERQIKLREIGPDGQTKLCDTSVTLGAGGFSQTVAARYREGAGRSVATAEPSTGGEPIALEPLGLRHPAAREVGEGAFRALCILRSVLGIDS